VVGIGVQACGGDSDSTGPSAVNNPPTIQSIAAGSVDVDADQSIQLTATVSDAETAPSALTYQWSSTPTGGTFTGGGAQVRWKAPANSPDAYTIGLTVVETFKSEGVTKENRVSSSVQVRPSDLAVRALVSTFLTDFATFSTSAAQCVRNFSDKLCSSGKASELSDISGNRSRSGVQIESGTFTISSVTFNGALTAADILAPCAFTDRFSNGSRVTNGGVCHMTAVYDAPKWYLCTSNFDPPYTSTPSSAGPPVVFTDRALLPLYSHP